MRLASIAAFCAIALLSSVATARDLSDYDPTSTDWNGLSRLIEDGATVGITVQPTDRIDFHKLDPKQPLIIIYPQQRLDVANLTRFVIGGGRVLLADDFGRSEEFLQRLEIQRIVPARGNLPHQTFAGDNPEMPIVTAHGRHPLLDGVHTVLANHPSVLSNVGGPVLAYDGGGGLVYDMNLGDGKVIVVADSSIFINQMLSEADNEVFAVNALRYICRDEPGCKPLLLTKRFAQVGTFSNSPFDFGDLGSFDAINDAISRFLDLLPGTEFLYWLTLLLGFGLAVYAATVFPIRRTRPYSAYVSDFLAAIPPPQSEFDWNVSRFGRASRTMNYALPISILKEIFEELFLSELGHWASGHENRPDVNQLGDEYAVRFLEGRPADERARAHSEVVRLLAAFAQIPPRSRVFLDSDANYSEAELIDFYDRSMKVLKTMGLHDEYQRRTRGFG